MIQQELEEKNPDFIFIGNSMLWSRIDDAYLGKLLGGQRVFSIVNFGGLSAVHYLAFKYALYPADVHPKKVFIFFRRDQFVHPEARTNDPFVKKIIERLSPSPDPLFEQLVHGRNISFTDRVREGITRLFPISQAREMLRKQISRSAAELTGRIFGQKEQNILDLVNTRFSFTSGSLRADIRSKTTGPSPGQARGNFKEQIEHSFLPAILRMAADKKISLVFVRVQERPTKNGPVPDPPYLRQYMHSLRLYLQSHNAALYDFTGDPELPLSAYHDGDHIKDQKKYTELFVRRMREYLQ